MKKRKKAESIVLKGVRQNNLKGFDVEVPMGKLTVVTGVSGSGKSSLVFETLHAEGQRRYVETFSSYTRQFLEMMDRPDIDGVENIRPSIAIEQRNSVKTSRSTVGTMTELCDYFKIWFCHVSKLYDPVTGKVVESDSAQSVWRKEFKMRKGKEVLLGFEVTKPSNMKWEELLEPLLKQGYVRGVVKGKVVRLEGLKLRVKQIVVVQDRVVVEKKGEARFVEGVGTAMHFGKGKVVLMDVEGKEIGSYSEGLRSVETGEEFEKVQPATFSFNSPIGACETCKGFGRTIDIDYNLVIPDKNLSIEKGAIRAFSGAVYGESLEDLLRHAKGNVRTTVPWKKLTKAEQDWVMEGDKEFQNDKRTWSQNWYGVKGFFEWLESKTYKMHVRFVLSRYRKYKECDGCKGSRLKAGALNWKWEKRTLPELYQMSVEDLLDLMESRGRKTGNHPVDLAAESIVTRLSYLVQVGLGYLTLDRTSRTLSGGEVERVNLTTCLGTSLVDTLFVLDEPSIGLHSRDIDKLVGILKRLTDLGNTVVVVEHDESIMRAADHIIEVGPAPGSLGGEIVFSGPIEELERKGKGGVTGEYLRGERDIDLPILRRSIKRKKQPVRLTFKNVTKNNIKKVDVMIPLKQLVCLAGVSGSGKSTLLNNIVHQGLEVYHGKSGQDVGEIDEISVNKGSVPKSILVDQSPITKTPRSNPALYIDAWDSIRELFARGLMGKAAGMRASHFSFNSGQGRCDHCSGLGYEKVEMQFLSDVFVTCPVCDGKRFKDEVLAIQWNHKNVWEVLEMDVNEAVEFFRYYPKVIGKLKMLQEVGLGYLKLGQPLNTLSGGECQRLKLMKHVVEIAGDEEKRILLLDEPTTGLHRNDIKLLIKVMQRLVSKGHSMLVIEHQMDVIKSADWVLEMGPEAGEKGGKIVAQGTPEQIAEAKVATAEFLKEALEISGKKRKVVKVKRKKSKRKTGVDAVVLEGAREHNLKNIHVEIPHREITVVTGVSGSGKSSLAFDIIFAEGQRRFMESISAYARQFIEQMSRPDIDKLEGIAPTVAIEQRVTRGTGKSTVATVTEAAQYLRLMYARVGTQFSPESGKPVVAMGMSALSKKLEELISKNIKEKHLYLAAPVVMGRKGHHEPVATWAENQGYQWLKIDGKMVKVKEFEKLDRYKEHDIDVVLRDLRRGEISGRMVSDEMELALNLGGGTCLVLDGEGEIMGYYSTKRSDPVTGEAFPELDPKHFSWNSPRGWCPTCHGHGKLMDWMQGNEEYEHVGFGIKEHEVCPDCKGDRLGRISRAVKVRTTDGRWYSLPDALRMTPSELVNFLESMDLDKKGQEIVKDLVPEIKERLAFMDEVGLNYLTLDRSSSTLSGGESQRIRLSAQLSSSLSGVLYVLDEPSIGLHARDSERLIASLKALRDRGNTLLVVEHDEDTMRAADHIIDIGPGAGVHGGEILASGNFTELMKNKDSLTRKYLKKGIAHPLKGKYRTLGKTTEWIELKGASLRNLKGGSLKLPTERLTMVCGISGAGKSTMVRDLLKPGLDKCIELRKDKISGEEAGLEFDELIGGDKVKKVIEVDQEPIGKTMRSTPATYIGAFDIIRDIYATVAEAKVNGFTKSHFSFNTKAGRCETCGGVGRIKLEMNFLPDTFVECESCKGRRYGDELGEVRWNGKNIWELLEMTFEEGVEFFSFHKRLKGLMELMVETGLGYLRLGQTSPTLSGGEAQRLKLVTELAKGLPTLKDMKRGVMRKNLYILEEPTIGLHLSDCERLINILHKLVDQGHTVIVIEHHLDLIAEGDYLVEIGPEGGDGGGEVLYQGNAKGILKSKRSQTASYLKDKLK